MAWAMEQAAVLDVAPATAALAMAMAGQLEMAGAMDLLHLRGQLKMREETNYNSGSGLGISTGQGFGDGWMHGYGCKFQNHPVYGDGCGLTGDGFWYGYSDRYGGGCGAGILTNFAWSRSNA